MDNDRDFLSEPFDFRFDLDRCLLPSSGLRFLNEILETLLRLWYCFVNDLFDFSDCISILLRELFPSDFLDLIDLPQADLEPDLGDSIDLSKFPLFSMFRVCSSNSIFYFLRCYPAAFLASFLILLVFFGYVLLACFDKAYLERVIDDLDKVLFVSYECWLFREDLAPPLLGPISDFVFLFIFQR